MPTHFGTDHHEFVVRPDAVGILDKIVAHFDEPFADSSAIPTWYVSELARRHVTVVLSGDGGDELFGGYDRYLPHARVAAFDRYSPPGIRQLAGLTAAALPHGVRGKNFLRHVGRDERGRYLDAVRFYSTDEKPALLSSDIQRLLNGSDPEETLAGHFDRYTDLPWSSQMMRFDAETYLPEDVLTKVDRMSMAHSIESRVPLLDNKVIDFASSLPSTFKIRNERRKHVLKEVAATLLPAEILARPKQGFGVPLGVWFQGNLRELFADTLLSARSLQRGYFQPSFVKRLVNEHAGGKRDHTLRLWQLVIFERWHRQYMDAVGNLVPLSAPAVPLQRPERRPIGESRGRFREVPWHPACSSGRRDPLAQASSKRCDSDRRFPDELRPGRNRTSDDRADSTARSRTLDRPPCLQPRHWTRGSPVPPRLPRPSKNFLSAVSDSLSSLRQLSAFSRWCRARRIAVVQTTELYSNIFGLPGAALARRAGPDWKPPRNQSRQDEAADRRPARRLLLCAQGGDELQGRSGPPAAGTCPG